MTRPHDRWFVWAMANDYAGPEQWERLPLDAVALLRDQALADVEHQEEQYGALHRQDGQRRRALKRLNDAKQHHRDVNGYWKKRQQRTQGVSSAVPNRDVLAAAFIARYSPKDLLSMGAGQIASIAREAYEAADVIANCSEDL